MGIVIVEIKARCENADFIRETLKAQNARFVGEDHQVDTYYVVEEGRLKLREGTIENTLIFYDRPDKSGPKRSDVRLFKTSQKSGLKDVLEAFLKTRIIVDKRREIYFIENVKFHIDRVRELGLFVEIEAIDENGIRTENELQEQCDRYIGLLDIRPEDLITVSYSDMLAMSSVDSL